MKIQKATTKEEIKNNFLFFKKMWKEMFDIDFDKNYEKQFKTFENAKIYFISENEKIISSSQMMKVEKWYKLTNWIILEKKSYILWRIWTLEKYRWKWLGSKLIKFLLEISKEEKIKDFYIPSELWNTKYYAKFWFETFWKSIKLGNSEYIYMKNN